MALRTESGRVKNECNWGILGCAGIATKFCVSVSEAPNAKIYAVASRSIENGKQWAATHCPDAKVYGNYEDLLLDPEVDAVYLPMPTAHRTAWALRAVQAEKHILAEKPIAPTASDGEKVTNACADAGLQYMDGTMFMHHTRWKGMRNVMDSPEFGKPLVVTSCFTIALPESVLDSNIRSKAECEPLGCIGDLGWYCIRFSLWCYKFEMPESVACTFHETTDDGVPVTATGLITFSGGRTASWDVSFKKAQRQWAEVASAEQVLYVDDFVIPQQIGAEYTVSRSEIGEKALFFPKTTISTNCTECAQHTMLAEKFSHIVLHGCQDGAARTDEFWPSIAVQTQKVVDACMESGRQMGKTVCMEMS